MFDCLIIGAGPAGLTAGIYLRRFHRSVIIVDSGLSRARKIHLSNNYPGFPEGVNGTELLALLRQQLERFDGTVTEGSITSLKKMSHQLFTAEFAGQTVTARTVLLATGVVDIEPDLPGYRSIRNSDLVRFCPVCDGFEHTDQRIGIIGKGQHGVRECEFIRNFSDHVSFICLETEPGKILEANRRLREANITVLAGIGSTLKAGNAAGELVYLNTADGTSHEFDVVYCALGSRVRSHLALQLGAAHDDQKCLTVDAKLATSVPGFYAAGDVVSGLDQIAVATGQAAIAATAIHNRLRDA
jgi:thioredoxin reductase (NADPH)